MGFNEMNFSTDGGLRNKSVYDATPLSEDDARDQVQGISDELRDYINNTLVAGLNNAETMKSGAEKIGSAPISMVTGATVYNQIKNLKEQIDGVSQGAVTPGSITDEKLADDVKVGSLTSLTTTAKSSVVGAINELDAEIGDVSTLTTTATTLASAINEIDGAMVDTGNIVDGAVSETKLAANAVTNTKIMNGQVLTEKLADGAVTNTKIMNGQVLTEKLADGAVTSAKLNGSAMSDSVTSTSSTTCATAKAVKTAYDTAVSANNNANGKAPISHASTGTGYGAASTSNYGHAKLYTGVSSTSTSLAATASAVKTAYDRGTTALNTANTKEPALHAYQRRMIYISSGDPGGNNDDIWIKPI